MKEINIGLLVVLAALFCFAVWRTVHGDNCYQRTCASSYSKPMLVHGQGCICVERAR